MTLSSWHRNVFCICIIDCMCLLHKTCIYSTRTNSLRQAFRRHEDSMNEGISHFWSGSIVISKEIS